MSQVIYTQGSATVTLSATQSVAVFTQDVASVSRLLGFANQPSSKSLLGTVANTQTVFGPYTGGATLVIDGGAANTFYEVGVTPSTAERLLTYVQADPVAVNVTGAVSSTAIFGGLITSTTAAAVAGTVPTGAVMELANATQINDAVDWSVIVTGANAFTVTAAAGHTLVGNAVVATATTGRFRTRKTAVDTFVTYRIA